MCTGVLFAYSLSEGAQILELHGSHEPCGSWDSNLSPLGNQSVLLTLSHLQSLCSPSYLLPVPSFISPFISFPLSFLPPSHLPFLLDAFFHLSAAHPSPCTSVHLSVPSSLLPSVHPPMAHPSSEFTGLSI